jgi:hypothetical protein
MTDLKDDEKLCQVLLATLKNHSPPQNLMKYSNMLIYPLYTHLGYFYYFSSAPFSMANTTKIVIKFLATHKHQFKKKY